MQADNCYSYLIIFKLLTPLKALIYSKDSLEVQFEIYKAISAKVKKTTGQLMAPFYCLNDVMK